MNAIKRERDELLGPDSAFAPQVATIDGHRRPKAGVFAVRAGPPLADNLRAAALGAGTEAMTLHTPQTSFLGLIGTSATQLKRA